MVNVRAHLAEIPTATNPMHNPLRQAYQQLETVEHLIQRLQERNRNAPLPDVPRTRFAVFSRPFGRLGGDVLAATRLDERHIGIYLADTLGHRLQSGLLGLLVQQSVRLKEAMGTEQHLSDPDEVLRTLNRELLDLPLPETPFLTMLCAHFNHDNGVVRFARAGQPPPLYVPRTGRLEFWQAPSGLLGVLDTEFVTKEHSLQPGDKLLLSSDGLQASTDSLAEIDLPLLAAAAQYRNLPIAEFVARIGRDLTGNAPPDDDWTLLGLEYGA